MDSSAHYHNGRRARTLHGRLAQATTALGLFWQSATEAVRYDFNALKLPIVLGADLVVRFLLLVRADSAALSLASHMYRLGWPGSYSLGLRTARSLFKHHPRRGQRLADQAIAALPPSALTQRYFAAPMKMLGAVVCPLKVRTDTEHGALLINYNAFMLPFLALYDVPRLLQSYNLILEPSWAGVCDLSILAYSVVGQPVYVQAYEQRDRQFLVDFEGPLRPIAVGPSWFIDHDMFSPRNGQARDIDIIMVASWARFKRHSHFFRALATLARRGASPSVALVGYPVDMNRSDIENLGEYFGVRHLLSIYEAIPPSEVATLLRRSKVNVLWSRFEGNNRALVEGMFCDTPSVLRLGHNYGESYDFINEETGVFAEEATLASTLWRVIQHSGTFAPRSYVMAHRNCKEATKIMSDVLAAGERLVGRQWTTNLKVKVNELDRMRYFCPADDAVLSDAAIDVGRYVRQRTSAPSLGS